MKRFFAGLKLHAQTPLILLLCILIFYTMGFGLLCLIMLTDETAVTWFPMGSLLALVGVLIFAVISYLSYHQDFMLALSLGRTRKKFMLSYALEQLLWLTLAYALVLALSWLERRLCLRLFPEDGEEFSMLSVLTKPWLMCTFIPVLVLIQMFCGALYGRFGKPFNVVMYIFWMSVALGGSRLFSYMGEQGFAWFLKVPAAFWIALALAGTAAMVLTTVRLGMKQRVQ